MVDSNKQSSQKIASRPVSSIKLSADFSPSVEKVDEFSDDPCL